MLSWPTQLTLQIADAGYGGNRADQLRVKNQFIYIDETFTRGRMKLI
jgi:hypothetical protein